jgi:hypothetical protein
METRAVMVPAFFESMRMGAVPKIGQANIPSSGLAAGWPEPLLHLVEE